MDDFQKKSMKSIEPEFLQAALINEELKQFWDQSPIDLIEDYDLNPHLYLLRICEDISKRVEVHIPCNKYDVMLYWLTMTVYHNTFVPKISSGDK